MRQRSFWSLLFVFTRKLHHCWRDLLKSEVMAKLSESCLIFPSKQSSTAVILTLLILVNEMIRFGFGSFSFILHSTYLFYLCILYSISKLDPPKKKKEISRNIFQKKKKNNKERKKNPLPPYSNCPSFCFLKKKLSSRNGTRLSGVKHLEHKQLQISPKENNLLLVASCYNQMPSLPTSVLDSWMQNQKLRFYQL